MGANGTTKSTDNDGGFACITMTFSDDKDQPPIRGTFAGKACRWHPAGRSSDEKESVLLPWLAPSAGSAYWYPLYAHVRRRGTTAVDDELRYLFRPAERINAPAIGQIRLVCQVDFVDPV